MVPPPYAPPAWGEAGANAHGVSLEVIKGGVVVEALPLPMDASKSFVVAGRMEPACDLVLQHPSVSRVHAALQFDAHGALFLRDLGSTHGTFVNKRRVPANEFVRLHIGDVAAFGESTRLYAVCGPQELLPPEREPSRRRRAQEREKSAEEEDAGTSWGFREDAQEEDEQDNSEEEDHGKSEKLPDYLRNLKEEDTPYKSTVHKAELNEKDQRLFQQLQAKITKMENLKQEKSRILAKQNQLSGLTDGQQQQLARNEQRIETLLREIEDTEEKIHTKNAQREQTAARSAAGAAHKEKKKKKSANEALYGYDSDEDDFYDRTRSNQQRHDKRKQQANSGGAGSASQPGAKTATGAQKAEALTASAIEVKIRVLEGDLVTVKEQLSAIELEKANKVADDAKEEEEVDSLDSFMTSTSRQLVDSDRSAVTRRIVELERELTRQRQLLAIAMPALSSAPSKDRLDTPQTHTKSVSVTEEETHIGLSLGSSLEPEEKKPSDSQKQADDSQVDSSNATTEPIEGSVAVPSAKDKATAPVPTGSKLLAHEHERSAARKTTPKAVPTEQLRRSAAEEPKRDSKKRRVVGPALPSKPSTAEVIGETNVLEGGDQVWVPPKNQSGDGRTALNDKFGY